MISGMGGREKKKFGLPLTQQNVAAQWRSQCGQRNNSSQHPFGAAVVMRSVCNWGGL